MADQAGDDFMSNMDEKREGGCLIYEVNRFTRSCRAGCSVMFASLMALCVARILGVFVGRDLPMIIAVLGIGLFGACAAGTLFIAGPCRLSVDPTSRKYTLDIGFPGFPRHWEGSIEDFECVCVSGGMTGSTTYHRAQFMRKAPGPTTLVIGSSQQRQVAETRAQEIASRLGIPYCQKCPERIY